MFGRRSNVRLLRGHWVCGMGALEQSPESKCRTCRLHKTGRPIIARICSSIENNKIWWLGDHTIFMYTDFQMLENLKIFRDFSDANAAPSRIMLPVKSQINLKLCKYQKEKFSTFCSLMQILLFKKWLEDMNLCWSVIKQCVHKVRRSVPFKNLFIIIEGQQQSKDIASEDI